MAESFLHQPGGSQEPLQALVSRIVRRPRPRPQYAPVDFEEVDGAMRRIPSGIAGADDAQSYDITSAIAPSQPTFSRDDDGGPETPVQLASGGRGESNPFQLVSNPSQAPGQIRYQRVCQNGTCRMVPVGQPSLPPGVVLGPGEELVPGSFREVAQKPAAAPQPAAQATPQPMLQPTGPSPIPDPPGTAMDILRMAADKVAADRQRYNQDGERYYAEADARLANRDAVGFVQYDERGDMSRQAGINADTLYAQVQMAMAGQANVDAAMAARQKRDYGRTMEGMLEEEAAVIAARGRNVDIRANKLFELRMEVAVRQKRQLAEDEQVKLMDMIKGEIYAYDASDYFLQYEDALGRWKSSGGKDDRALQDAYAFRAQAYGNMLERFRDAKDRSDLESRMRAELTPIFRRRFTDFYNKNPSLLPQGVSRDASVLHAQANAARAVEVSIAQVAKHLNENTSPYDSKPPALQRRQDDSRQGGTEE